LRAGVEPGRGAGLPTMRGQGEITALQHRADDIGRFIADGKQRTDVLDQVARLAEYMAERLPLLDPSGVRLVVTTLDLRAKLTDPANPDSEMRITSRKSAGALTEMGLVPSGAPSSTEA
jgi:hypothetical protein